jgi:hypothetical protein
LTPGPKPALNCELKETVKNLVALIKIGKSAFSFANRTNKWGVSLIFFVFCSLAGTFLKNQ